MSPSNSIIHLPLLVESSTIDPLIVSSTVSSPNHISLGDSSPPSNIPTSIPGSSIVLLSKFIIRIFHMFILKDPIELEVLLVTCRISIATPLLHTLHQILEHVSLLQ